MRQLIESYARVSEDGAKIAGIAAVSRFSRNDIAYFPNELASQDGKTVPLNWMHTEPIKQIGEVTLHWDEEKGRLMYEGVITDRAVASLVRNRELFVSIGADYTTQNEICDNKQCYNAPLGLDIFELSIVDTPGIPEVTLNVLERLKESFVSEPFGPFKDFDDCLSKSGGDNLANRKKCGALQRDLEDTSLVSKKTQFESMTDETQLEKPVEDLQISTKKVIQTEPDKKEAQHPGGCPPGQKDVDGKCVPIEPAGETKEAPCDCQKAKTEEPKVGVPTTGEPTVWAPNQDLLKNIEKIISQKVDEIKDFEKNHKGEVHPDTEEAKIAKDYQIAKVSTENDKFDSKDINFLAKEMVGALNKNGYYSWNIDLTPEYSESVQRVQEAITFTNDQAEKTSVMDSVFILPNGKYVKSVRNLVRFKEIKQGSDTALFHKGDIPNNSAITEGSTVTADTNTVTTISVTADNVRGDGQSIKGADIEDSPFGIMSYLNEAAKAESMEQEATLVYDTTADAETPGLWIQGDTGATITADDTASIALDETGISFGLEYLEGLQYDTRFGQVYCMLHPQQLRELRDASNLQRYVQVGDATVTRTGKLTHLYGVELIPSTAITNFTAQTNNAHRAVMAIKGHTFALASKRELKVTIADRPDEADKFWLWTVRKGSVVFDPASYVRISTTD